MLQARHHLCWYLKGISHANYYKEKIVQLSTLSELHAAQRVDQAGSALRINKKL